MKTSFFSQHQSIYFAFIFIFDLDAFHIFEMVDIFAFSWKFRFFIVQPISMTFTLMRECFRMMMYFFQFFFLNPLNAWMRTKLYSSYIRHLQIISPNRTHNLSQSRGGAKYKSINFQILTIGCDPFFSSTKFTQIRSTNPNLSSKANDKSCAKLVCQRKKKNQWHTQNFNENNDEQKENIGDAFYF